MRAGLVGATLVLGLASGVPALAQSPLDGPLASPDAPAATSTAPVHRAKAKQKKIRHAAARPAAPTDEATPPAHIPTADATPASSGAPAGDPLDLGMKWNGNNDNAAQTRSQNLDGNAFGTGAEVGMKLHF